VKNIFVFFPLLLQLEQHWMFAWLGWEGGKFFQNLETESCVQ